MASRPAIETLAPETGALHIPRHIGVIMDGNGRWAKARGKPRTEGHLAGVGALRRLVELCIRYEVPHLTVFSFSSENWTRPPDEVSFILGLMRRFVAADLNKLVRNNVRVRIIGERETLDQSLRQLIANVEGETASNSGLLLAIAFNYGGKAEITQAARRLAAAVAQGHLRPEEISEERLSRELYTAGLPDPDLIIRTSGEQRFSNFLLWQAAYAELVFVEDNWPDFDERVFLSALRQFSARDRRYGGLGAAGR